jgi:hypothetical protein
MRFGQVESYKDCPGPFCWDGGGSVDIVVATFLDDISGCSKWGGTHNLSLLQNIGLLVQKCQQCQAFERTIPGDLWSGSACPLSIT